MASATIDIKLNEWGNIVEIKCTDSSNNVGYAFHHLAEKIGDIQKKIKEAQKQDD